jgi:iron complex transport system substrate-binding protein
MAKSETPQPRVVSLLASATEIVAELGCLDWLVGRSHECDFPPQVQSLPVVSRVEIDATLSSAEIDAQVKARATQAQTAAPEALQALSLYRLDVDLLRDLRPDVILTQTQCEVCAVSERDVTEALRSLTGIAPRVVSLAPYRLSDVWRDIARVGEALGRAPEATTLITGYTARLDALRKRTSSHLASSPRVAMLEWLDPLMAAGNWTPELIEIAGGNNLFGRNGEHSPWLTWEELAAADPDIIVLAPCGFELGRTLADLPILQAHPIWASLTAVRTGRVFAADGNAYFNRSGPRLVDSAEILAAILWGGETHHDAWLALG